MINSDHIKLWLGNREAAFYVVGCNVLTQGNHWLDERRELGFDVIRHMPRKSAELLAMTTINASGHTIFSTMVRHNKLDILFSFITKLSSEICCQLALTKVSDGDTYFTDMLRWFANNEDSIMDGAEARRIDACAVVFLRKLTDEVCNQLALHQNEQGNTGLSDIAWCCGNRVAAKFISRLTTETCDKVALVYDKDSEAIGYSDLCYYTNPEIIEQFSAKLSPDVLFHALTDRNNKKDVYYAGRVFRTSVLEELLESWEPQEVLYFLNRQLSKSDYRENLLKYFDLCGIHICDGGGSIDTWSIVTNAMISDAVPMRKRKGKQDIVKSIAAIKLPVLTKKSLFQQAENNGWKFSRLYGRSIIFKNNNGDSLVFKIQKKGKGEELASLEEGYKKTKFLGENKDKFQLMSYIPTVVDYAYLEGVNEWAQTHAAEDPDKLRMFLEMIGESRLPHGVFVYRVQAGYEDYFTYLHDTALSDEQYARANEIVIHDLFVLLRLGLVFNQLADLYHNLEHVADRDDKGRYIILATLLSNMRRKGSGRLTGWLESSEYLNMRGTSLPDLGDCISINDLIGSTRYTRHFYGDALSMYGKESSNYLFANTMAEYQYIPFITAGRRALSLATSLEQQFAEKRRPLSKAEAEKQRIVREKEIYKIWLLHANQVMLNCARAVSVTTQQPVAEALAELKSIVDVHKLARQMQFWMTTEYINYVKGDYIPKPIYGEDVPVIVRSDLLRANTFNSQIGFSINGKTPDLGPVNGQEPLKEANKLFYWMVSFIYKSYKNLSCAIAEVKEVVSETNVTKSEDIRKYAFTYLPDKAYHRLQHALCEERLCSNQRLSRGMQAKLKQESEMHKQTAAALTIQGFWRKRQNEQQSGNKKRKVDVADLVARRLV